MNNQRKMNNWSIHIDKRTIGAAHKDKLVDKNGTEEWHHHDSTTYHSPKPEQNQSTRSNLREL
jgi:hypothetical protein